MCEATQIQVWGGVDVGYSWGRCILDKIMAQEQCTRHLTQTGGLYQT